MGDACDPNPDAPTERWQLFATMHAGDQPFGDITGFTQEADALRMVGSTGPTIARPLAPACTRASATSAST